MKYQALSLLALVSAASACELVQKAFASNKVKATSDDINVQAYTTNLQLINSATNELNSHMPPEDTNNFDDYVQYVTIVYALNELMDKVTDDESYYLMYGSVVEEAIANTASNPQNSVKFINDQVENTSSKLALIRSLIMQIQVDECEEQDPRYCDLIIDNAVQASMGNFLKEEAVLLQVAANQANSFLYSYAAEFVEAASLNGAQVYLRNGMNRLQSLVMLGSETFKEAQKIPYPLCLETTIPW